MQTKGGFARRLWPKNFGDSAAWNTANSQRNIKRERAGGDGFDFQMLSLSKPHDGAIAISFENIPEGFVKHGSTSIILRIATASW